MEDYNNIKPWLIPLIDAKGMSIEDLAKAIGVTRAAIYFYLNDKTRPTEQTMIRICQVLERPVEEGMSQYIPRRAGRRKNPPKPLEPVPAGVC
jgi:transcriptional regulator with XRE-family HTH domain